MMPQFKLVNMKNALIGSQDFYIVLSISVRTWLICFSRPEFCWSGFLVIEVFQTERSPRGSCRWMNKRENIPQIQLLRSILCLEKNVAKLTKSACRNLCRLWDLSSPALPDREPWKRKKKKKRKSRFKKILSALSRRDSREEKCVTLAGTHWQRYLFCNFLSISSLPTSKQWKKFGKEAHYLDGSCFDISETSLGVRWGQALAKPMEQTLEGLRRAGEIVSRWSWSHLKGEGTGGSRHFISVWMSVWVASCAFSDAETPSFSITSGEGEEGGCLLNGALWEYEDDWLLWTLRFGWF